MVRQCCLMLALLLFLSPRAGATDEEWRAFERTYDAYPVQALKDAEQELLRAGLRGDKRGELKAIRKLTFDWYSYIDRSPALPKQVEHGIALARELQDVESLGRLYGVKSAFASGAEAEALSRQAIAIAEQHNLGSVHGNILLHRILSLDPARASDLVAALTKAYRLFERAGDNRGMARALVFIANGYMRDAESVRGNEDAKQAREEAAQKAVEYGTRALALIDPEIYKGTASSIHIIIAWSYVYTGDYTRARAHNEKALKLAGNSQPTLYTVNLQLQLAYILTYEGRYADAIEHLDGLLRLLRQIESKNVFGLFVTLHWKAKASAHLGRKRESLEALSQARALLPSIDAPLAVHNYLRNAASTYELLGDYQHAYSQIAELRNHELHAATASNRKAAAELIVRFDAQLREAENALLRSKQKQAETKRIVLLLALAMSLMLLGAVWYYLWRRATAATLEAAHHKALAAAEAAANDAKRTFLANMSHELRSPLNVVLGFTQLLMRRSELPDDAQQDLCIVYNSGQQLYTVINQVLDLSKIEAGRLTLNETDFDLYALLDELADMFSNPARQKGLQLTIENEPRVPQHIHTDALKLRQALINLLSNAIKFTSEGSVSLSVSVTGEQEAMLTIAVSDTGPGVSPNELDKLGSAFVQAEAGRVAKEGTGLGLAISSSFVQLMGGGPLKFSSRLGEGMTIAFELPVRVAHVKTVPKVDRQPRVLGLAAGQAQYRILIADDSSDSRRLLARALAPLGCEVREAENGETAVAIWDEWSPHLIWMDIRMPVMDGPEAARRIKAMEKGSATVIIALTASSYNDEREQILAGGCDDFLSKPFRESDLFDMMRKHLGAQFIYEGSSVTTDKQVAPDAISSAELPAELREQLRQASKELDVDAMEVLISRVRGHDQALADTLEKMAYRYEYDRIQDLVSGTEVTD